MLVTSQIKRRRSRPICEIFSEDTLLGIVVTTDVLIYGLFFVQCTIDSKYGYQF